jgi:phosphohistidine phosphatase
MAGMEDLLLLVRHGEASPEEHDPERHLTERGRRETERVARWASRARLSVTEIRHSGKTRAAETAQIFAALLHPPGGVVAAPGLRPKDTVEPVAAELDETGAGVMLVGHLPFLARLVGHMVAGDAERELVRFAASALVALSCLLRPLPEDDSCAPAERPSRCGSRGSGAQVRGTARGPR